MSFTSEVKPAGGSSLSRLMAGGRSMPFFFWLFLSAAQADTDLEILEAQLGMASTFVSELDAQAGRCRDAGVPSAACSAFRLAINASADALSDSLRTSHQMARRDDHSALRVRQGRGLSGK